MYMIVPRSMMRTVLLETARWELTLSVVEAVDVVVVAGPTHADHGSGGRGTNTDKHWYTQGKWGAPKNSTEITRKIDGSLFF